MKPIILASSCPTLDDYLTAERVLLRRTFRPTFQRLFYLPISIFIIFGLVGCLRREYVAAACFLLPGGFGLIVPLAEVLRRRRIRKRYRSRPDKDTKQEWRFSDEGIRFDSALASATYRWELILKFVESTEGFFLWLDSYTYLWIPRRAFEPDDIDDFIQLATLKTARKPARAERSESIPIE